MAALRRERGRGGRAGLRAGLGPRLRVGPGLGCGLPGHGGVGRCRGSGVAAPGSAPGRDALNAAGCVPSPPLPPAGAELCVLSLQVSASRGAPCWAGGERGRGAGGGLRVKDGAPWGSSESNRVLPGGVWWHGGGSGSHSRRPGAVTTPPAQLLHRTSAAQHADR